uniref:CSON008174 protein n=1 Tax=Culicoides sonorensis TaxID=179676 RepID=A0A336MVY0_CULSO
MLRNAAKTIFVNKNLPSIVLRQTECLSTFAKVPANSRDTCKYAGFAGNKSLVNNKISGALGYCTNADRLATYDEIKNLPNTPEKYLIDVRTPFEIKRTGRIPTSINIPLGDVERALSDKMSSSEFEKLYGRPKPKTSDCLIFSCCTGRRSQMALDIVGKLGYQRYRNYKGSWMEWAEKLPVATYEDVKDLPNHPEKYLIDVRHPYEIQRTGKIPTSINVPIAQLAQAFSDKMSSSEFEKLYGRPKPSVDDCVMFTCCTGRRSTIAQDMLLNLGYKRVRNYKGSWMEWVDRMPVATYSDIKDLPNQPDRYLIDVPNALSDKVSPSEFEKLYGRKKPTVDDCLIFSCCTGRRSQIAQELMLGLGFKRVRNYKGSWMEWAEKEGLRKKLNCVSKSDKTKK